MTKKEKYESLPELRKDKTLQEIGNLWGVSKVMVWKMCKDIGLNVRLNKWRSYQVNP